MSVIYVDFTPKLPTIQVEDDTASWIDYEMSHQALMLAEERRVIEESKPKLTIV